MLRLILIIICFLLSLFTVFPATDHYTWYLAILAPEFPWIFLGILTFLFFWSTYAKKYKPVSMILSVVAFILFLSPVIRAYMVGSDLNQRFENAYGAGTSQLAGDNQATPYTFSRMITGIGAEKIPYTTVQYAVHTGVPLTLDFYKAQKDGARPCVVIVHGGGWWRDNSHELPDMNSALALAGYNVASINYRLAPQYKSPAPQEDVHAAMQYLRQNAATLNVDTNNFVLLGRSAGGQIVLTAAYTLHESGLKGVVSYYGPTDMIWAYTHPDKPAVMHSQKVMADFFGGTLAEVPEKYVAGSPMNFVTPQSVPTLLIHGENDVHVHYDESARLDSELQQYKVPHFLLTLPWATHGCDYTLNGPSGQLSFYTLKRFLNVVTHSR